MAKCPQGGNHEYGNPQKSETPTKIVTTRTCWKCDAKEQTFTDKKK